MRIASVCLLFLILFGCEKKNENDCTPSSEKFIYQENKSIDTTGFDVNIVNGTSTVFEYRFIFQHCPGELGASVSQSVFFRLPDESIQTNFQLNDSTALAGAGAVYFLNGPIDPRLRTRNISDGSIQATKKSASVWHLKGWVKTGSQTINF